MKKLSLKNIKKSLINKDYLHKFTCQPGGGVPTTN